RRYSRITVLRRVSYLRSQAMTAQRATPVSAGDGVLVVPGGDPAPLFGRAELPLDDVAAGVHGLAEAGRPAPREPLCLRPAISSASPLPTRSCGSAPRGPRCGDSGTSCERSDRWAGPVGAPEAQPRTYSCVNGRPTTA